MRCLATYWLVVDDLVMGIMSHTTLPVNGSSWKRRSNSQETFANKLFIQISKDIPRDVDEKIILAYLGHTWLP